MLAPLLVFLGTYLVLALGRLPGFRVDRTGAAIIGATLMVSLNVISLEEAYEAIDYNTILLLFGMMIVVANLRLSGFFSLVTARAVRHFHHPFSLLAAVVVLAGLFSAFFVNDTICIVLTPLVLEITAAAGLPPIPYLLAVAMASNAGSVATLTGNPQNMIIGNLSGIGYHDFALALSPVAALSMLLCFLVLAIVYRKELARRARVEVPGVRLRVYRPLLWKSLLASGAMLILFFAGWSVSKAALLGAAFVLVTRRVKPRRIYQEIDWSLLVLFAGLFVVVAGVEKAGMQHGWLGKAESLPVGSMAALSAVTALLSNILGNVPAVLVMKPVIHQLPDARHAWLVVAMASTLAGNLTLVGSVANLIVAQRARQEGVEIRFGEYLRAGVPLTLLSIAAGMLLL